MGTTPRKLINYEGLYGDPDARFSSEYLFLELIATRSKKFDWNIKPHIHKQLYQIFVIEKNSLQFQEVNKSIGIKAPAILFIPPGELHGLYYSPQVSGQILTLSDTIFDEIIRTSAEHQNVSNSVQIIQTFDDIKQFENILLILQSIHNELFSENHDRRLMLRALLTQFFLSIFRLCKASDNEHSSIVFSRHYRIFKQNLKEFGKTKSIPEYADCLNISAVHLNRICKTMAGQSAIGLLQQHMISEAKKYLLHTSYSISEISYKLDFEYPNYFSKVFKKSVGFSPGEFRKINRK